MADTNFSYGYGRNYGNNYGVAGESVGQATVVVEDTVVSSSGVVVVSGSSSTSFDGDTIQSIGAVAVTGSSVATQDATIVSASSSVVSAGFSSVTFDSTVVASAGRVAVSGQSTATIATTTEFTGRLPIEATSNSVFENAVVAAVALQNVAPPLPFIPNDARPYPFSHSWDRPYEVAYEFGTDIGESRDGTEQRRSYRSEPRIETRIQSALWDSELHDVASLLGSHAAKRFLVPQPIDFGRLTSDAPASAASLAVDKVIPTGSLLTIYHPSVGGAVRTSLGTAAPGIVAIDEPIYDAYPVGSKVMLTHLSRALQTPRMRRLTDRSARLDVQFESDPGTYHSPVQANWPLPAYRGRPLLLLKPNWSNDVQFDHSIARDKIDFGYGRVLSEYPIKHSYSQFSYEYTGLRFEGVENIIQTFFACKGRLRSFYTPSWQSDYGFSGYDQDRVVLSSEGAEALLTVPDVIVWFEDDTYLLTRATEVSGAGDFVTFKPVPAIPAGSPSVRKLSKLYRARWTSDRLELSYSTDTTVETEVGFRTLGAE